MAMAAATMGTAKLPVYVLTGFLGSGKTVLLNALLSDPRFSNSAVVVNEFGDIGLDHLLVSTSEENIILLDAGCLCCAVLGSLKETLADLHARRAQGELPPFERVLIETTGLADPGPIIQSITRDPLVSHFYELAGVICVVDAVHGLDQLNDHFEARNQAAVADRLIVTKTDLLGGATPPSLAARLRALNPTAEILVASHGAVSPTALLGPQAPGPRLPWIGHLQLNDDGGHDHLHGGDHSHDHHQAHDREIGSECFRIEAAATWAGIAAWTAVMRGRYGRDLLRCKGILNVAGQHGPVVLHGVQTTFDTTRLPQWPDEERCSRLVLIGRGLDRVALEGALAWLHAPEGTMPPLSPDAPPPA